MQLIRNTMNPLDVILRKPISQDGPSVHHLINQIPELDSNSIYSNLLQCSHFSDTSIIAVEQGETVGFISGYVKPGSSETLFVWQVAVCERARGMGIASRMLKQLVERQGIVYITHVEATITQCNTASWALFNRFSKQFAAPIVSSVLFDSSTHFNSEYNSEWLARIGPLIR